MDNRTHLQLAARIHFALRRHYGVDIEIGDLMKNQGEAREALWVFEASDEVELVTLARQFKACREALAQAAKPPEAPKPTAKPVARHVGPHKEAPWARNTGFDASTPAGMAPLPTTSANGSKMHSPSWLKRSASA